jgi:plasmid stabilization system protein ParE
MTYRIRQTRRANRDVDAIFNWIANVRQARQGATSWRGAYRNALAMLAGDPESYPEAIEADDLGVDLRQFTFKTRRGQVYRGVFTVDDGDVLILRIRGPGQAPLDSDELGLAD